jgi:hypothetical protein
MSQRDKDRQLIKINSCVICKKQLLECEEDYIVKGMCGDFFHYSCIYDYLHNKLKIYPICNNDWIEKIIYVDTFIVS